MSFFKYILCLLLVASSSTTFAINYEQEMESCLSTDAVCVGKVLLKAIKRQNPEVVYKKAVAEATDMHNSGHGQTCVWSAIVKAKRIVIAEIENSVGLKMSKCVEMEPHIIYNRMTRPGYGYECKVEVAYKCLVYR